MTPQDVDLVQSTYEGPAHRLAAPAMFYDRLFEIAPEVRPLFKGDMGEGGQQTDGDAPPLWSALCTAYRRSCLR